MNTNLFNTLNLPGHRALVIIISLTRRGVPFLFLVLVAAVLGAAVHGAAVHGAAVLGAAFGAGVFGLSRDRGTGLVIVGDSLLELPDLLLGLSELGPEIKDKS